MKNKLLTISISIAILLIGISVFYYLMIFLPNKELEITEQQEKEEEEFMRSMKQECGRVGKELYEQDKKELAGYADFMFDPKYGYNENLNTCLYSSGYTKGEHWERWVKDSYTNEKIIFTSNLLLNDENEDVRQRASEALDSFWERHKELFGE